MMSQGASGTAVFVYDASGALASEFDSQSGAPLCYTCYVTEDHLGSTRVVTSAAADLRPGCAVFRQDDLPFGEPILTSGGQPRASATGGTVCTAKGYLALSPPLREQFTGQQLDAESSLNFFQARYFAGGAGRFMSPDPAGTFVADPTNPQSWNLYSYVMNNPLSFIDPSGLCSRSPNGDLTDDDKFGGTVIQPGPCLVNGQIGDFGNSGKNSTTVNGGMSGVAGAILDLALGHPTPTITSAPSQNPSQPPSSTDHGTPWYQNSCIQNAALKGAVSAVIDAIGIIPEGSIVSRAIGNAFNYRGIVADQFGNKTLGAVRMASGIILTGSAAHDASEGGGSTPSSALASFQAGVGVVGITTTLAGATPGVGQVIAGISVIGDFIGTAMEVANCR